MSQELYKNYFKVLSSVEIQNKLFVNENVGIGTLNPTEKLDVSGNVKISGDLNVNSNVQILSSLTVKDNVTVLGKLSALGESYFANTIFSTTSAICAYNIGPGPALYVYQAAGPYDVASFVDGDGVEVLHVGNASTPSGGGKIGINNGDPNKELSVRGSVSATEMAYFDGNVLIGIEGQRISNLTVTGDIEITNNGTGPALKVTQTGSQDIASFYDDANSALIIKDGGNIGVGTLNPNKKLTVIGEISSTGSVYFDGNLIQPEFVDLKSKVNSLSSNWNSVYTSVNNTSGNWNNVYTSVNNTSADWSIIGDRYFTTSISTNSINKGTKVFAVSANLSYIPTQGITIVYDHDISRHMQGTVLDYNSSTGSLTADINSHTGSGSYSNWKINLGGTPTFVDSLIATNNLSDVASPSTALMNLSGVSRTELQSLSASWSPIRKFDMVYSPNTISYSGTAPGGSLTSQSAWKITKVTFALDGSVESTGVASGVAWNDRLTATYL